VFFLHAGECQSTNFSLFFFISIFQQDPSLINALCKRTITQKEDTQEVWAFE
jgi:hypothetical protein